MKKNTTQRYDRYEFKYRLDALTYMQVYDFVTSLGLQHDAFNDTPYPVTSLYFESIGLDDYYDKAGGYLVRKKLRARVYAQDFDADISHVYLEIKNKHDMFVDKKRVSISIEEWKAFLNDGCVKSFDSFSHNLFDEGRIPFLLVRYMREAFVESFHGGVRLTFDRDIEVQQIESTGSLHEGNNPFLDVLDGEVVMEVKFSHSLPWWFGVMVRKFDLQRLSFSKYANSVDKVYQYTPLSR
ncbi:MAG: polyphosphate polymerase domain-containing protein [Candidatus Magasanikbacteria bacterium]|jgi:hypothetical protein|nr:polyphosphate polymerase domain-containing protein [Candidatus Magasanikbacteria bacterium]MBT4221356.1 polyphosphate polymerase domain-containing protein [Candidatus Magasanikbacteria bacterium]MBT4350796.1 polyphosphate polymerase domain-containing protein [Candidatus Magasanikbacteria bacterium]MBT4541528.1 polyphosphate polymerase domain-containing protein [Candidatus Magasanikbacteria bacterium]MBT6253480.1 polyphosphate polymerase domain-containing protein [Candidatus Magasanikbacteria